MSDMITPGGNPVCKHCGNVMMPGVNICWTGVCMCGEDEKRHGYVEDHGYVDSGEYNKLECEADEDVS